MHHKTGLCVKAAANGLKFERLCINAGLLTVSPSQVVSKLLAVPGHLKL